MTFSELTFIMILGLILFGPDELPKVARTAGKFIYEIKKATEDVQQEVRRSIIEDTPQKPMPSAQAEEQDSPPEGRNETNPGK